MWEARSARRPRSSATSGRRAERNSNVLSRDCRLSLRLLQLEPFPWVRNSLYQQVPPSL